MRYRYLQETKWSRLPLPDFRPRFFVEVYLEKLSLYTPHFFQSRLMNVISSSREAAALVALYKENERNAASLRSAIDEVLSTFEYDEIAKTLFNPYFEMIRRLINDMQGESFGDKNLQKMSVVCRAISSREADYEAALLSELRAAIIDPTDLTQRKRITSRIYAITGLYTTQLLNRGYSPTYLYNRADSLTRQATYGRNSFAEQFDEVTDKLKNRLSEYEVYFGLKMQNPQGLLGLQGDPDFSFSEDIPEYVRPSDAEKFKRDAIPNVIAKTTVEATDYVSAGWRIKERLDKFIDAYSALETNPRIYVLNSCIAVSRNAQATHVKLVNIELLVDFLASEGGTYFTGANTSIRKAMLALTEEGADRLGRSLRYLRLARESISIEQKLLNLWISLESLFDTRGPGVLSLIMDYVPVIYAVSSIRRRVIYLRDLLSSNEIPTTPLSAACLENQPIKFSLSVSERDIYNLLSNEQACIELFNSLGSLEHLKFRLISIFDELRTNEFILRRIEKATHDVSRQLRRIYLLRNRIAHTGHYEKIRPQLVTHLLDYVAVCYMAICSSAEATNEDAKYSVSDLLLGYRMGVDVSLELCRASPTASDLIRFSPNPLV